MNTPHMVMEVPATGESVARNRSFTGWEMAEVGVFSVAMHAMCFSLMAEEASVRRKVGVNTLSNFAPVGLQVGVEIFAIKDN